MLFKELKLNDVFEFEAIPGIWFVKIGVNDYMFDPEQYPKYTKRSYPVKSRDARVTFIGNEQETEEFVIVPQEINDDDFRSSSG